MKTIVVSAVNLNTGGTLTILRDCLYYLSQIVIDGNYRVIALVHKKELAYFEGIEYIELPWSKKRWVNRLWCEYVSMKKISKDLSPVYLWLSLHDTTPNVRAVKRAVYCHNPFPFYDWRWREILFNYKIVLFSWFSYFIYRINIHRNYKVIVQQQWIKREFGTLFSLDSNKIIVSPPERQRQVVESVSFNKAHYTFLFSSSANLHKNFEVLCDAAKQLEVELGTNVFRVVLTISPDSNRYSDWLYRKWGNVSSIDFAGFMSKEKLYGYYKSADCLVFPSKVETWGLPITEFMAASSDKPMLLADLPYAHETAAGASQVCFFNPSDPNELKERMRELIENRCDALAPVPRQIIEEPKADSWKELFEILLK